jgi:hypothetical protein
MPPFKVFFDMKAVQNMEQIKKNLNRQTFGDMLAVAGAANKTVSCCHTHTQLLLLAVESPTCQLLQQESSSTCCPPGNQRPAGNRQLCSEQSFHDARTGF